MLKVVLGIRAVQNRDNRRGLFRKLHLQPDLLLIHGDQDKVLIGADARSSLAAPGEHADPDRSDGEKARQQADPGAQHRAARSTNENTFVPQRCLMFMLTKNDFLPTDWNTLQEVPHLVGLAALIAGASGIGTIKESMALAQGIMEGQSSDVPLIRDLSNRVTMQEAQRSMRDTVGALDTKTLKDRLNSLALEGVAAMMSILDQKGSPEEASAVRLWLYSIAEKVAKSANEGGFFGFGGTQVSEDEQAFLTDLRTALGLQLGMA